VVVRGGMVVETGDGRGYMIKEGDEKENEE
jgi:hypothetical protein